MLDIYTSFICNAGICYLGITVYLDIHVLPKLGAIRIEDYSHKGMTFPNFFKRGLYDIELGQS